MDILKQLNNTVIYIENNLCGEIDTDKIAEIALCPYDKFKRFFSYMTNMSVSEYVRKRRLSLAAYELLNNKVKIIELAVKYGYNSADSFTRAFAKQHGVLPTEVSADTSLKVYPPVSFYIAIKGANELNFRIVNTDEIKLKGISRQFTGLAADRFEQEHIMWSNQHGDVLPKLRERIFDCWFPDSEYEQTHDYEVEIYYLYPKNEKNKRYYEIWIPIIKITMESEKFCLPTAWL